MRRTVGSGAPGSRLVVGGGRVPGFPMLRADDISLNIAHAADPHVLGDVAAAPFRTGAFGSVYFERVPFTAFTGRNITALDESARVLQPGGRIVIETGIAAPVPGIQAGLRAANFVSIRISRTGLLRIIATLRRR